MKIVTSLSGGMDSTTLLAKLLSYGDDVHVVNFQYGSKHNKKEQTAALEVASYYNRSIKLIHLEETFSHFNSNLLKGGGSIPEGHYAADNMAQTIVPGRNAIMTTILAGYAESHGFDAIALGQHKGDHTIYPDCRKEFIEAMDKTIQISSDGKVKVMSPFININKADICGIGIGLQVPYELTTTCYNGRKKACGLCGSCVERIEAFLINKAKDPIEYEIEIDWKQSAEEFISSVKK